MKTAAIYSQVSTEEQVGNTSLKGQLDACREYAQKHGYLVTKEVQEDFSGARLDRPGLTEIRDMLARGDIQALIVYEADRLSRKMGHLLLLHEEFDRLGRELLFVNSQDDTGSPEGMMFFQMRGAFIEYEKSKITERFRLGKMRLAKQGKIIGNRCQPLGYALVAGQYVILEDEARIVRQIFEWMAYDRLPLRQIGLRLAGEGATTKQGSTRWLPTSIKAILDNRSYAGTFYWNKTQPVLPKQRRTESKEPRKNEKTSKQRRDESEWVGVPCPAIISEELWQAAHKQLQTNRDLSPRNTKRTYLLRGMIKCELCGYRYYGRASSPTRCYYYCGGKNNREAYRAGYTGELCPSHHLRADRLEERVWQYVKEQITDEEKLLVTFDMRDAGLEVEMRRDQNELESVYAAEERVASERNKMLDLYAQDLITLGVLQERLAGLHKRAESLTETKSDVLGRIERRKTTTATTEALREYCRLVRLGIAVASKDGNTDYRREFLEILEIQLVIGEKDIHITGLITGELPLSEAVEAKDGCLLRSGNGRRL